MRRRTSHQLTLALLLALIALAVACFGGSSPEATETPEPIGDGAAASEGTSQVLDDPVVRYVSAADEGVPLLSACSEDAETGERWEHGERVQVHATGTGVCAGWSLARAGTTESWILDEHLASSDPRAAASDTATPAPTEVGSTATATATPSTTSTATPVPSTSTPSAPTPPPATSTPTPTPTATPTEVACNFEDSADLVRRATVQVLTDSGWGTAFYIGGGEFVTAAHVVADVSEARLLSATVDVVAEVVGTDPVRDIAILRAFANVPAIGWGDASGTTSGATVGAVGYPLLNSNSPSVVKGVFSRIVSDGGVDYVQTDAAINPGNSGGPLFDICGDVLGVVSFVIRPADGFGFAIAEHEARSGMVTARANPQPENVTTVAQLEEWLLILDLIDDDVVDVFNEAIDSDLTQDNFDFAAEQYQLLFDETKALQAEIRGENYTSDGEACEVARAMLEESAKQLSLSITNLRDAFAGTNFDPDRTFETLTLQLAESRVWRELAFEAIDSC
jgi:hypothetical protein